MQNDVIIVPMKSLASPDSVTWLALKTPPARCPGDLGGSTTSSTYAGATGTRPADCLAEEPPVGSAGGGAQRCAT